MKKQLIAASLAVFVSGAAQADILRIEGGAGMWQAESSGSLTYSTLAPINASDDLGYKQENLSYLWLFVKHPVPILPNVRFEYVDTSFDGNTKKSINWMGGSYGLNSYSKLQIKQTDLVLYYNLLDNTFWATLDLGLDIKFADVSYELRDSSNTLPLYSESTSLAIPMLYARTRAQVPGTGFGLEADVKYITAGSTTIYDFRAKVDYTFDFVPVVQPAIELGYRTQKFKIDEADYDVKTDIDFSGIYAGIMLRF